MFPVGMSLRSNVEQLWYPDELIIEVGCNVKNSDTSYGNLTLIVDVTTPAPMANYTSPGTLEPSVTATDIVTSNMTRVFRVRHRRNPQYPLGCHYIVLHVCDNVMNTSVFLRVQRYVEATKSFEARVTSDNCPFRLTSAGCDD